MCKIVSYKFISDDKVLVSYILKLDNDKRSKYFSF
jgi:hypothetical protein